LIYEYKVEPIPEISGRLISPKSIRVKSAKVIQTTLEAEIKLGWEFLDIKTIKLPIKKAFFRSAREITVSLLFFRKLRATDNLTQTLPNDAEGPFSNEKIPSLGPAVKDKLTR
jgi:hypothetical protein